MVEQPSEHDRTTPRLLDAGALRALAHPLRIEIYDLLSRVGPQTASSLAERLGESTGVTSYHLRALAKHDLIREIDGRGTGRERWWERPRGSISMSSADAMKTPAGKAASQAVVIELYRQRNDMLMRYLESGLRGDLDDWDATLSTANIRMTHDQFEQLSDEIQAVVTAASERYRDQEGDDVALFNVRLDIIPLDPPQLAGDPSRGRS